jgi:hypothetical protein
LSSAWPVTQTIKDVVQSLVDDGLVELEKIGSANYFWSFPSKTLCLVCAVARFLGSPVLLQLPHGPLQKRNKIDAAKASMVAAEKSIVELEATLANLSSSRADSVCLCVGVSGHVAIILWHNRKTVSRN